ncbi:MAG: peptide ABC transporter substrate-binding protein [Armatimonadota bacterium]|nr:peptide ABC transporter substrate-binding protein [Armatimonadota bacterium]MDR5697818.1 peptide ABC transporter substrate-binding protein [Armatimonadota bacterium]
MSKDRWTRRGLLLAAAFALAVTIVPLSPGASLAQQRDQVVIGAAQEPSCLITWFEGCTLAVGAMVMNSVSVGMVDFNDQWRLFPRIAEKIPTLRDGDWQLLPNNRMRVTWRLKRTYTWHDGRPVTALDVSWTYLMARNPRSPTVSRFVLRKIENMQVPNPNDPYALVVNWNERYPFANLGHSILPRHRLERQYLQDPSRLKAHPEATAPTGNGPYRFVEWVRGSHITLEAYDRFPEGRPQIRRIVFRWILDATVLQANAIAGQVDVTDINNFDCVQVAEIERRNPDVAGHYTPALIWEHIDFNLDNEWLRDVRVRHALAHAINRAQLAELACPGGRQPVAHTWLPPRHEAHNPNVRQYAFDQARARALLAEAGFTPGPDGILRDRQGRPFSISIMTTAGNRLREQVQQVMRDQLRQVGVDLRIDNRPAAVLFGQITARRQFPHLVMYAWVMSPVTLPAGLWHSSQIPRPENNWEGQNNPGWRNAENDRLIDQIMGEVDTQRRIQLLRRQQEIWANDLPAIPLFFRLSLTTSRKSLQNVKPAGLSGTYINWNSHEWSWAR